MNRWVWLSMAVAAVLRLNAATGLQMDADEPIYLQAAGHYAAALRVGDLDQLMSQPHNPEHPAMMKLVHGVALIALGEDADVVSRLGAVRAVEATGGIVLAGLMATVHPVAGLVVAAHALTIKYTSQGYLDAWPMVFMSMGLLCWRELQRSDLRRWSVLLGLALGAAAAGKLIHALPGVVLIAHLAWTRPRVLWVVLPVAAGCTLGLDPGLWSSPIDEMLGRFSHHVSYTPDVPTTWTLPLQAVCGLLPVRWHPDIFRVSLDPLFALVGVAGLGLALRSDGLQRSMAVVGVAWFIICTFFLLAWPTRWAQHALILVVPIALGCGWFAQWARALSLASRRSLPTD